MHKRLRITTFNDSEFVSTPDFTPPRRMVQNRLNLLPNELLLFVFEYLSPFDLIRAFDYDWVRFGACVTSHIVQHGLNLLRLEPADIHLLSTCLSLIEHQHLNVYVNEGRLLVLLQTALSLRTLSITLDMPCETSVLSMLQQGFISCEKLIIQCKPICYRPISIDQILPLLSASVHTLVVHNMLCFLGQLPTNSVLSSLHHIRCMVKTEHELYELLLRLPMLQSMDIRLVSGENSEHSPRLPLPPHFRIEYASSIVVNPSRYPGETRIYDQTVYSLPWLPTNSSLLLRSCDHNNYLGSFPRPLPSIRRLTIECGPDPWSLEFVVFLRQTFPRTRTLYAIQSNDRQACVMTVITANDRKNGTCALYRLESKSDSDWTLGSNALRFVNADDAYS